MTESLLMKMDFDNHFARLVKWFRIKMTKDQADMVYSKVHTYPLAGFMFSVEYFLENFKPTPGNFPTPKEIVSLIFLWFDQNPEEKIKRTRFDTTEDLSYPVKKLWDGYEILMKRGDEAFSQFALRNRMPANDQERVRMKANIVKQGREGDFNLETGNLLNKAGVPF